MNQARVMVEKGFVDYNLIQDTRRSGSASESDLVHQCKDGSFVYEGNWFDWDDEQGKAKNYRTLSVASQYCWNNSLPMEEEYWEDHNDMDIKEYSEDYFEPDEDFYGFEEEYV